MNLKYSFLLLVFFTVSSVNCEKDVIQSEHRPPAPVFEKFDLSAPHWMFASSDSMARVIRQCISDINSFNEFFKYLDITSVDFKDASTTESQVQQPWKWKFRYTPDPSISVDISEKRNFYYFTMTAPINQVLSSPGGFYIQASYPYFLEADKNKTKPEYSAAVYHRQNLRRIWEWNNEGGYLSSLNYFRKSEPIEDVYSYIRYQSLDFHDTDISNYFMTFLNNTPFYFSYMDYKADASGNCKFNMSNLEGNKFKTKISCDWNKQGEGSWSVYDNDQVVLSGKWNGQ